MEIINLEGTEDTPKIILDKTNKIFEMSKFKFNDLPYDFNALEPYIDARTMEIHYTKHHKAYFDKFTAAVEGTPQADMDIIDIFNRIQFFQRLLVYVI